MGNYLINCAKELADCIIVYRKLMELMLNADGLGNDSLVSWQTVHGRSTKSVSLKDSGPPTRPEVSGSKQTNEHNGRHNEMKILQPSNY